MKPYVYIVVRKDIKPCNYAPQIAHAALEAGYYNTRPNITTHLVLLEVDNKQELEMVAMSLAEEIIDWYEFHEGFADMGFTALATEPINKPKGGVLRSLKLFTY